jgi:hypothetical protein
MSRKVKNLVALSLPVQIILIQWVAGHPAWVEQYYSRGVYPGISTFFRLLYGWIPFSVGDVCYFLLGVGAILYLIRKWYWIRHHIWLFLRDVVMVLAVVHFTFYLLWGMNYFRQPLSKTLGYQNAYSTEEITELAQLLALKTNQLQEVLTGDTVQPVALPYNRSEILHKTVKGYKELEQEYPNFRYSHPSLKPSLFSTALSYMGYGGYLNPFTLEAQVNKRLPGFRYPVVCGHEVGHQLGYSAENETNFIGYLVTLRNPDPYFQYSAYAYALSYCLSEVSRRDPDALKAIRKTLNPGVRGNFKELREFWKDFENPLEPVFKSAFNKYLEVNRQKDGIRSYNRVVALMVAYHRKDPVELHSP